MRSSTASHIRSARDCRPAGRAANHLDPTSERRSMSKRSSGPGGVESEQHVTRPQTPAVWFVLAFDSLLGDLGRYVFRLSEVFAGALRRPWRVQRQEGNFYSQSRRQLCRTKLSRAAFRHRHGTDPTRKSSRQARYLGIISAKSPCSRAVRRICPCACLASTALNGTIFRFCR